MQWSFPLFSILDECRRVDYSHFNTEGSFGFGWLMRSKEEHQLFHNDHFLHDFNALTRCNALDVVLQKLCVQQGGLGTVENYSDSLHISDVIIGLCK